MEHPIWASNDYPTIPTNVGPSLFAGVVTLGAVTQTGNAFGKVNDSFSYLIDHWTEITKFMSVIKRLKEFEKHLILE